MNSPAHDRLAAVAPTTPAPMEASQTSSRAGDHRAETWSNIPSGVSAPPNVATESRAQTDHQEKNSQNLNHNQSSFQDERFSQSDPRSEEGSQASVATSMPDQVFTPTPNDSENSSNHNNNNNNNGGDNPANGRQNNSDISSQDSQLMQLSLMAAAQDRMKTSGDAMNTGSRKRMADGEVKSPTKSHSRTTSAVSMVSTASTIGELSSDLKTRLSYAMVKVNNGWQSHSLGEVESLASQAASPASSTSTTVRRRHGSSSSSQLSGRALAQVTFGTDNVLQRPPSNSPPIPSDQPTLAPPAPIRSSAGTATSSSHPRRNSNPSYTPTLLSHSHSASPHSPGKAAGTSWKSSSQPNQKNLADSFLLSPPQNVREQDAIESLLFMSSPNNSANMKHTFSPSGSPDLNSQPIPRSGARHALPGTPRKALPSQRPSGSSKRVGFDVSAASAALQASPMDLDLPHQSFPSSHRGPPRKRTDGGGSHTRGALSLPTALGISNASHRRPISEKDIDQMLDRADELNDSSDGEEIQLPVRRSGIHGAVRV